jgi:hypothetical protein
MAGPRASRFSICLPSLCSQWASALCPPSQDFFGQTFLLFFIKKMKSIYIYTENTQITSTQCNEWSQSERSSVTGCQRNGASYQGLCNPSWLLLRPFLVIGYPPPPPWQSSPDFHHHTSVIPLHPFIQLVFTSQEQELPNPGRWCYKSKHKKKIPSSFLSRDWVFWRWQYFGQGWGWVSSLNSQGFNRISDYCPYYLFVYTHLYFLTEQVGPQAEFLCCLTHEG